jgi:hypothetical protein
MVAAKWTELPLVAEPLTNGAVAVPVGVRPIRHGDDGSRLGVMINWAVESLRPSLCLNLNHLQTGTLVSSEQALMLEEFLDVGHVQAERVSDHYVPGGCGVDEVAASG